MGGTPFVPETVKLYDKGWRTGKREGKREGIALGEKRGIALGRKEGILATAWRMKDRGLSPEQIADLTGLSLAEVEELRGDEAKDPT